MLKAEAGAVRQRLREISSAAAHGTLVEFGLLPNYALIDTRTDAGGDAHLGGDRRDGDRRFHSELREYARPARQALVELAPGNSYYVRGYKHEISGLDVGPADRPAYEQWRVCAAVRATCGPTWRRRTPAPARAARDHGIADHGRLFQVLRPTRVHSRDKRDDARIRDDSDDRDRRFYATAVRRRHRPRPGRVVLAARARHLRRRLQPARDDPALQPRRPAVRPGRRTLRRRRGADQPVPHLHVLRRHHGRRRTGGQPAARRAGVRLDRRPRRRAPPALVPVPARRPARRTPTST